jgi:hypothetical protein
MGQLDVVVVVRHYICVLSLLMGGQRAFRNVTFVAIWNLALVLSL